MGVWGHSLAPSTTYRRGEVEGRLGRTPGHHPPPPEGRVGGKLGILCRVPSSFNQRREVEGSLEPLPGTIHHLPEVRGEMEVGTNSRAPSYPYRRGKVKGSLGGTPWHHPAPIGGEGWRGAWEVLPGTIHAEMEGSLGGTPGHHPPNTGGFTNFDLLVN